MFEKKKANNNDKRKIRRDRGRFGREMRAQVPGLYIIVERKRDG